MSPQVIDELYESQQKELVAKAKDVRVAADGRCDSPGHCALYCVTTMMDAESNLILSSQLVKV